MRERHLGRKTAQVSKRAKERAEASPVRLLLWTALLALILAGVGVTQVVDEFLRVARNHFHRHAPSGEIVLVSIDDRAISEIGRWPWPRRYDAQLIDKLTAAGAKKIFFDITFDTKSNAVDDDLLATAIERSGRVTLASRWQSGPDRIEQQAPEVLPMFSRYARLASIGISYNYQNAAWKLPYSVDRSGSRLPSFASALAGITQKTGKFTPDYSIRPTSIPTLDATSVLQEKFDPRQVAGKTVIVGTNSEVIGDIYYIPGVGKMGGVYIHVIGAETLKEDVPVNLGWVPSLILAFALTSYAAFRRRGLYRNILFTGGIAAWIVVPTLLDANLIFLDVVPGLFVLITVWSALSWRSLRKRGLVNPISDLPNLSALRSNRDGRNQALIAARILNYDEISSALPSESERQLVDQIVARLRIGAHDRRLYQGDGGIFAWFEDPKAPFSNHLDALYAMFRNPARVDGLLVDLSVAFGVEVGSSRSLANRLASALVAAEEAAHDGLKWKYHDPDSLQDASWRLSMLSQLDEAIDGGEVWVAYQPKLDIASRRIIGAEALARWTHPDKGPIAATEFVAAAEQHNRIGKLTDFVLEKAVAAAAQISKRAPDFEIAVNLSARLLSDKGFTLRLSALLARHSLPPNKLTLELTETAALAGDGNAFDMIGRLRELGVRISIDDYGTGLSTLEYLKKIPAGEIKIDQSFVKGMADNRSDRLMVQSTISLAHSLGRKVVAEGVEDRDILDLLTAMKCDIAQGYVVGRPMSLESLSKRIGSDRKRSAA
jgi:EAL domain-containing protein (putative c-di-GMP-specific phosphodiesterase class I)/CHASE2 domain-containing sensor protein